MSTGWSALGDTFMSEGEWAVGQGWDAPDRQFLRKLLWRFPSHAEAHIEFLEVGMGPGIELKGLEKDGLLDKRVRYTGFDFTPEFVTAARERYPELRFEVRDVQEPFGHEIADVVWARHLLEHVPDVEQSLRNLYAATRSLLAISWFIRPTWCEEEVGYVEPEGFLQQTYSAQHLIRFITGLGGFLYRFDFDHHTVKGSVWLISKGHFQALRTVHKFMVSDEFLDALISVPPDPREREHQLLDVLRGAERALDDSIGLARENLTNEALEMYQDAKTAHQRVKAALEDA